MASLFCTGWGEGMRRGLNRRWALLNKIKQNKQQKLPVGGKTGQLARLGRAGQGKARQGRAGQEQETFVNELAQDCKHKDIIKGANEALTRKDRWGKLTNN